MVFCGMSAMDFILRRTVLLFEFRFSTTQTGEKVA